MGRNSRRRQQRAGARRGAGSAGGAPPPPAPKPRWRETFEAWGGVPVFGSIAAVVVVVAVLIYLNRPGSSVSSGDYTPIARATVNGLVAGSPDAPVKIVAFEDFQCVFCKRFTLETEPQLQQEFVSTGIASIQFVPFSFLGEESIRAAEAAQCAADQKHFWDYHDVLYLRQGAENSGVFSASNLKQFARELAGHFSDFDVSKFDQCLDSGEKRALVDQQTQQAKSAGISTTPTFLINGARVSGAQPLDVFRQAISAAQTAAGK